MDNLIEIINSKIEALQLDKENSSNQLVKQQINNKIDELCNKIEIIKIDEMNINNVINEFNNIEINESNSQNENDEDEKFNQNKYLPLEVSNYYCKTYFDDEDFVYTKLKLPDIILNNLSERIKYDKCFSLIDFFKKLHMNDSIYRNKYLINKNNSYTFDNYDIYLQIVKIYINYLKFNSKLYERVVDWSIFGNNLNQTLDEIFQTMRDKISFDYLSDDFKDMEQIYKEVTFGIRLIMLQMDIIRNYYRKHNLSFQNYSVKHQNRFVRLLNNFCVIMIFIKFATFNIDLKLDDFLKYNNLSIDQNTYDENDCDENNRNKNDYDENGYDADTDEENIDYNNSNNYKDSDSMNCCDEQNDMLENVNTVSYFNHNLINFKDSNISNNFEQLSSARLEDF